MDISLGIEDSLKSLSDTQLHFLQRIITSFQTGVQTTVNPNSDLCSEPEFSEYFSNLFSIYHSITEHKFEKKSFEFAFKYASIASGHKCEINKNSSNQGEDVTRGDEKISLKTEGEKAENTFKISKFSEARFIAKYKTENEKKMGKEALLKLREEQLLPKLVEEFKTTVKHHLGSYDRIIGLKSQVIEKDGEINSFRYRLIEIPKSLIEKSLNLAAIDFKPLRGNGGTSASVYIDGKKAFGITIDGSVEKISITGIKISACTIHAEYIVPVSI